MGFLVLLMRFRASPRQGSAAEFPGVSTCGLGYSRVPCDQRCAHQRFCPPSRRASFPSSQVFSIFGNPLAPMDVFPDLPPLASDCFMNLRFLAPPNGRRFLFTTHLSASPAPGSVTSRWNLRQAKARLGRLYCGSASFQYAARYGRKLPGAHPLSTQTCVDFAPTPLPENRSSLRRLAFGKTQKTKHYR